MYPILVDAKDFIISGHEDLAGEVAHDFWKSSVTRVLLDVLKRRVRVVRVSTGVED